eukprot:UN01504
MTGTSILSNSHRMPSLYSRKKPSELLNQSINLSSQHPIDCSEGHNALHPTHSKLRTSSLIAVRPSLLLENATNLEATSSSTTTTPKTNNNNNNAINNLGLARTCTANMGNHENTNNNNMLTENATAISTSNGIKRGRLSSMIQRSSQTDNNDNNTHLYDETQPIDEEQHNNQSNTTTNIQPKRSLYTRVNKSSSSTTTTTTPVQSSDNNVLSSSATAMNMI